MYNQTTTDSSQKYYKFDDELKEELTWNKICEQLDKSRWNGEINSRFSLIRTSCFDNKIRKKRL